MKNEVKVDDIALKGAEVKQVPLQEIKPYGGNPRKNDKSVYMLEQAIERFGFLVPITVDKDNVIITGHSRYTAAKNLGLDTVATITLDHLSEREVMEYRIADNKVAEFTFLDFELKGEELKGYTKDDELMSFAFPEFDSNEFEEKEDEDRDTSGEPTECMCPNCLHEFDANSQLMGEEPKD